MQKRLRMLSNKQWRNRMIMLSENVKQYLWEEFRRNNIPKFYKYFDEWIENLTDEQISFYTAYSEWKKTIDY